MSASGLQPYRPTVPGANQRLLDLELGAGPQTWRGKLWKCARGCYVYVTSIGSNFSTAPREVRLSFYTTCILAVLGIGPGVAGLCTAHLDAADIVSSVFTLIGGVVALV